APLQLDVDLRPRVVDPVPQPDEPVVAQDEEDDDQRDHDENHDQCDHGRERTGSWRRHGAGPRTSPKGSSERVLPGHGAAAANGAKCTQPPRRSTDAALTHYSNRSTSHSSTHQTCRTFEAAEASL